MSTKSLPRWRQEGSARAVARRVLIVVLLVLASSVILAGPSDATGGFTVASGFASYIPGGGATTPTPVQFDVLTLASGGTAAASTLSVTGQPSSGIATANAADGIVTYSPTSSTTGDQTVTFELCEAGPTDCQTSTLTEGPATAVNDAFAIPLFGGYGALGSAYGALGPVSAAQDSTFTEYFAPAAFTVPASINLDGVPGEVSHLDTLTYVLPVPAGAAYVSGSALVEGGDAATAGQATVEFCTSTGGTGSCTATTPSSAFPTRTQTPYLELQLESGVTLTPASTVTVPTVVAQFIASGDVGSIIEPQVTEWDTGASLTISGNSINDTLSTYPVLPSFTGGSNAPSYAAYPLSTTTVTAAPSPPTISDISPTSGPAAGGTAVTIDGTNLESATAVDFGTVEATVTADTATSIVATSPAGTGSANVSVTTSGGVASSPTDYTYLTPPSVSGVTPNAGPVSGGSAITITGTGFAPGTTVAISQGHGAHSVRATDVTVVSPTEVTALTGGPALAGRWNVFVTTAGGTSAVTDLSRFTYRPTVTGVSPASGPAAGGTPITISGTGFASGAVVAIGQGNGAGAGAITATSVAVISDTEITAITAGPALAGRWGVFVTVNRATSTASSAATFRYG